MGQGKAQCAAASRCSTGGAKESGLGAPGGREKSSCAAMLSSTTCHVMLRQSRTGLAGGAWHGHADSSGSCGLTGLVFAGYEALDLSVSVHKAHTCRRPRRTGGTDEATYQQPWAGLRGAGACHGAWCSQHLSLIHI